MLDAEAATKLATEADNSVLTEFQRSWRKRLRYEEGCGGEDPDRTRTGSRASHDLTVNEHLPAQAKLAPGCAQDP